MVEIGGEEVVFGNTGEEIVFGKVDEEIVFGVFDKVDEEIVFDVFDVFGKVDDRFRSPKTIPSVTIKTTRITPTTIMTIITVDRPCDGYVITVAVGLGGTVSTNEEDGAMVSTREEDGLGGMVSTREDDGTGNVEGDRIGGMVS